MGAGRVYVLRGSMMPNVGFRLRWEMPIFAFLSTISLEVGSISLTHIRRETLGIGGYKIAVPVVSLPVPAVVGTQISGFRGLSIGSPFPSGAFT